MVRYGYWPNVDAKLAEAERRLIRLHELEADARAVEKRWNIARRSLEQNPDREWSELTRAYENWNKAQRRLTSVSNAVLEQSTLVRQLRNGVHS